MAVHQRFSDATELHPVAEGCFAAHFDRSWWVVVGPNGGLIAALLVQAAQLTIGEGRVPRTITVHYIRPPREGDAEVEVEVQQSGRSVSFVTCRMSQGERLLATAVVALALPRASAFDWEQRIPPSFPPPEQGWRLDGEGVDIPIRKRWEQLWTMGVPGEPPTSSREGQRFEGGGWLRLAEPEPYTAAVVAAMSDAWVPTVMVHSDRPVHTPTLELTVHFRRDASSAGLAPEDRCQAVFRQLSSHEGFLDETGEIWTPDGRLLADFRQIGLVIERPEGQPSPGRTFRHIDGD